MKIGKWLLPLLAAAVLTLPGQVLALQKGETVPSLKGQTIDGKDFDLSSYKGKAVLLKVGTTWCPDCVRQTKAISKLTTFLKEQDIPFIDVFYQEDADKVRKYYSKNEHGDPAQVVLDEGDIAEELNLYLIPRVIVLDKEHRVYRDGNTISSGKLRSLLEEMLGNS